MRTLYQYNIIVEYFMLTCGNLEYIGLMRLLLNHLQDSSNGASGNPKLCKTYVSHLKKR